MWYQTEEARAEHDGGEGTKRFVGQCQDRPEPSVEDRPDGRLQTSGIDGVKDGYRGTAGGLFQRAQGTGYWYGFCAGDARWVSSLRRRRSADHHDQEERQYAEERLEPPFAKVTCPVESAL